MNKTVLISIAGLGLGFIVGAFIGFAWSQGTKSGIGDHTRTTVGGGKITVEVDYAAAAAQGAQQAIMDWWG